MDFINLISTIQINLFQYLNVFTLYQLAKTSKNLYQFINQTEILSYYAKIRLEISESIINFRQLYCNDIGKLMIIKKTFESIDTRVIINPFDGIMIFKDDVTHIDLKVDDLMSKTNCCYKMNMFKIKVSRYPFTTSSTFDTPVYKIHIVHYINSQIMRITNFDTRCIDLIGLDLFNNWDVTYNFIFNNISVNINLFVNLSECGKRWEYLLSKCNKLGGVFYTVFDSSNYKYLINDREWLIPYISECVFCVTKYDHHFLTNQFSEINDIMDLNPFIVFTHTRLKLTPINDNMKNDKNLDLSPKYIFQNNMSKFEYEHTAYWSCPTLIFDEEREEGNVIYDFRNDKMIYEPSFFIKNDDIK